jgi:hypothetical protein
MKGSSAGIIMYWFGSLVDCGEARAQAWGAQ